MNYITKHKCAILNQIKFKYGLNENAEQLLKQYFNLTDENKTWDLQQTLIEYVIKDKILCNYQPHWKYKRSFFKQIIKIVEDLNDEVNEVILENYINIINSTQASKVVDEENYFMVIFYMVLNFLFLSIKTNFIKLISLKG